MCDPTSGLTPEDISPLRGEDHVTAHYKHSTTTWLYPQPGIWEFFTLAYRKRGESGMSAEAGLKDPQPPGLGDCEDHTLPGLQ